MYKEFLQGEIKTFEGKYDAQEYILMAENRLNNINKKLKEIKNYSFNNLHKIIYPNLTPKQILKFRKYFK